ncbi:MAG: tRNA epoxyqueuosine(34) reductase QueG [Blastocatellia bacterium]
MSLNDKLAITQSLKQAAAELGIDKIGIAPAEPLKEEYDRFLKWIAAGMNGEMAWLARGPEKRFDPRRVFPEARSVIVAAVNYFSPFRHSEDSAEGKISRYAWGDDYHLVVKEKLERLIEWLKTDLPEIKARAFVDTAPLMEKPLAVRAGVGWIGKNANLITREYGSWVFLGVILTDLDLYYDSAFSEDHCGNCRRCLDACPTGAITEPYVVDSRRCISYATIELRAENLPQEITANQDGWLYGCDVCQDVCPWNRFEKPTAETAFWPRAGETEIPPQVIAGMTPEEYLDRFRRSAIKRAKLTGLKRNARSLLRVKS